jgi:16S rRNA (guanine(966)-N(2))-methyltransferase RsmD
MRIIAGEAKNRQIKAPHGIRPTQDKLRATIFDVLGEVIEGVRFLDLFAGSGAVGIEALSRGAREAVFVDSSRKVIEVLQENVESVGYSERATIISRDALKMTTDGFDVVFADPPYGKDYVGRVLELRGPETLLIVEHSKHEAIPVGKHYESGDSVVTFIPGHC